MIGINTTLTVITLNINSLDIPEKRWRLWRIAFKTQLYAFNKKQTLNIKTQEGWM